MSNSEDFFSPERVDERLDLSLLLRDTTIDYQENREADPDLLLIHDLRYFYGEEGTEHVRSLQRVWERLTEQRAGTRENAEHVSLKRGNLRLLKQQEKPDAREMKRRERHMPGRGLAALAAVLFLVIMVGSLLAIVHLMRPMQSSGQPIATGTPAQPPTPAQPTSIPDYPYPAPGQNIAVSPNSPAPFSALIWSPDGKQLALSAQSLVWYWDPNGGNYKTIFTAPSEENITALAWSPNDHYLAVGSNPIWVIDPATGRQFGSYSADYPYTPVPGQTTQVTALAWSPDGTMLATATRHADGQCFVNVWNVNAGTPTYTFKDQTCPNSISSISWSSDSKYVASVDGQSVLAWDAHNGYVIFQHAISGATDVAWSPSGPPYAGELAFVDQETTEVWNVWAGQPGSGQMVSSYSGTANGTLAWAPDGQYLATASGRNVIIFNAQSGLHLYTYAGNTHDVSSLAWSPDGSALASGEGGPTGNNVAHIWSA